jgi:uncharacterized protein YndB with AHSA1/START domain
MDVQRFNQGPVAKTGMLIRRPVALVFEAFIDPEITTRFWFTRSNGRLEAGKQVRWEWEMYDVAVIVTAKAVEQNRRIVFEWPGYTGSTVLECLFSLQQDDTTFVSISESGFNGDTSELIKQVAASTEGFTLVLAGLKAFLEHNVRLNLVFDRYPHGIGENYS